ncbi:uncharacterized protein ACNS7B_006346 isoform 2-T3 [Menidia menidia]
MLIHVKYGDLQKYVKLEEVEGLFDFNQFHEKVIERFCLPPDGKVRYKDATDTEVDEEIFSDLLRQGNVVLTVFCYDEFSEWSSASESDSSFNSNASTSTILLDEMPHKKQKTENPNNSVSAKNLVEGVLQTKSGGEEILQEYETTETLTDATRRQMVNILVADMIDKHGHLPTKAIREKYAFGIVTLFPSLKDPYTKKGYEHFYDAASSTGYISWRLKTVLRKIRRGSLVPLSSTNYTSSGGPNIQRTVIVEKQLDGNACQEAISLLNHTTDRSVIFQKMRETFEYRHKLIKDASGRNDILATFKRFLDTKGLIDQDFSLLFSEETSSRLLQKWDVIFKPNVIKEAKRLTSTPELRSLVQSAESLHSDDLANTSSYDQEMASLLLLLHLLPPQPGGQKSPKISASDAVERLVVFHKSCCSLEEHLRGQWGLQPYLLAVGRQKSKIDSFYIVMDKSLKPFSLKDEDVVNKEMLQMISSGDVFSTSWVRVEGVEYRPGLAVCSTIQDEMPVFCQISDVLLVDNTFLLLSKQLFTETFDDHHHAFRIVQSEERHLVKIPELKFHKPFDIQNSYGVSNECLFIVPQFKMLETQLQK